MLIAIKKLYFNLYNLMHDRSISSIVTFVSLVCVTLLVCEKSTDHFIAFFFYYLGVSSVYA